MEVILTESIDSLGMAGEVVRVADGYARNYLLPRRKALVADKRNLAQFERQREKILARAARQKEELQALAGQLERMTLTIAKKVGEEDRLYGSVTAMDISEAIEAQGYTVDRRKILLEEPIKQLGTYEVPVKLGPEVSATLKVEVVAQEA
ncbi:50S ribosomal protein L9 [Dissulfurirhabdus thermomarina]|uniref:Large ribosomal subunit protein bL9 n=1 Tax=Dissulfurirhabdus thermomarina TaxID=1765737 RepID=A0A6N9TPR3_DISTH|nr:50S ribosomal protein L9 [Dissulfurirhabdus thermomarina]NDY41437.1 50S ribosomal protein L9 [Dissulfurirhabdus thermomarina]NMX24425.1 50S ribosomal protein L9 [Dissulfurirhabdus thermomarina]